MRRFVLVSTLLLLVSAFWGLPVSADEIAGLLADIELSGEPAGSSPYGFTPVSRSGFGVVFGACDGAEAEVWSSDGSETGTFPLPGVRVPCGSSDLPDFVGNIEDEAPYRA